MPARTWLAPLALLALAGTLLAQNPWPPPGNDPLARIRKQREDQERLERWARPAGHAVGHASQALWERPHASPKPPAGGWAASAARSSGKGWLAGVGAAVAGFFAMLFGSRRKG